MTVVACAASAPGPLEQVTIPKGASFRAVADSLHRHGIVEHPRWFRLLARVRGLDRSARAGIYRLPRGSRAWDVIDALERGEQRLVRVTVPEGLTIAEMAPLVAQQLAVPADSFVAAATDSLALATVRHPGPTLEGFLLPETYLVPEQATARELVRTMATQFAAAWQPGWDARLDSLGMTRPGLVALASIVEGEARVDGERAVIAGVYHNRLQRRMPLQADPTVQYAIQLATGERKPRLLNRDYRFPSPYNTYLHPGLPPGPVNSPGLRSIEAALYPAQVPYIFFVASGDGRHLFTRTYGEHLRAIAQVRSAPKGPEPE
jgi:UPF0755 protein